MDAVKPTKFETRLRGKLAQARTQAEKNEIERELRYERSIRLEEDASRQYYATGNGRRLLSLDACLEEADQETPYWVSDRGEGAEKIRSFDENPRRAAFLRACRLLAKRKPELVFTFCQIIENGNNREESIWNLMTKKPKNGKRLNEYISGIAKKF